MRKKQGKSKKSRISWNLKSLMPLTEYKLADMKKEKKLIGDKSPWWAFIFTWPKEIQNHLQSFIEGTMHFEPMIRYKIKEEITTVWPYPERIFVRALLAIIKPVFHHIISPNCFHLKGPSGVQGALGSLQQAWNKKSYRYFLRIDIKSYYASIDHKILVSQIREHFKDTRVLKYLIAIITIPYIQDGVVYTPSLGIPICSSLSPFFGALYLSPLDNTFTNLSGIFYVRFCDDIVILATTKKQFLKAKKRLQKILCALKLNVSTQKTKMGILTRGFHFLGVDFQINEVSSKDASMSSVAAQTQCSQFQVNTRLHPRSCVRAMGKISRLVEDSVDTEKNQRYLSRWATWWNRITSAITRQDCLRLWVQIAKRHEPSLAWFGTGLLLGENMSLS